MKSLFSIILFLTTVISNAQVDTLKLFIMGGNVRNTMGIGKTAPLNEILCAKQEITIAGNSCFDSIPDQTDRLYHTIAGSDSVKSMKAASILDTLSQVTASILDEFQQVKVANLQTVRDGDIITSTKTRIGNLLPTYGRNNGEFGAELTFGHIIAQTIPNDVVILKVGDYGANLYNYWRSPSIETRLGEYSKESTYPYMLEKVYDLIDNPESYFPEYNNDSVHIEIAGFIWVNSFLDCYVTGATTYDENLKDLINDLRTEFELPNLPVVIAESNADTDFGDLVREAQQEIAALDTNMISVQTDDISTELYFNSATQLILGSRIAYAMDSILNGLDELNTECVFCVPDTSIEYPKMGDTVKVFIMAGQSNMEGHTKTAGIERLLCAKGLYTVDNPATYCYDSIANSEDRLFNMISDFYWDGDSYEYGYDANLARNEAIITDTMSILTTELLCPNPTVQIAGFNYGARGDSTLKNVTALYNDLEPGFGNNYTKYGPELSFGHQLSKLTNNQIMLIKVVEGGTDLYEKWRSPTMESRLGVSGQESLYPQLVQHVQDVVANPGAYFNDYSFDGVVMEIAGFVWFQGWNDACEGTGLYANSYEQNLTDFVYDLRTDLGIEKLPVAIGKTHNNSDYGLIVQQAQENFALNDSCAAAVSTNDLSNYYHFDAASHLITGQRLAFKMDSLMKIASLDTPTENQLDTVKLFIMGGNVRNTMGIGKATPLNEILCAKQEVTIDGDNCYNTIPDQIDRLYYTIAGSDSIKSMKAASILDTLSQVKASILDEFEQVKVATLQTVRNGDTITSTKTRIGNLLPTYGRGSGEFGAELTFGHIIAQTMPNDVVILKVGDYGANLYNYWRSPSIEARLGEYSKESTYPYMLEKVYDLIDNPESYFPEYDNDSVHIEIAGFIWINSDADSNYGTYAGFYEENLSDLISDLRLEFNLPYMPVVIGEDNQEDDLGEVVRDAQQQIADADTNVIAVPLVDVSNELYFNSATQLILGGRIAYAMDSILNGLDSTPVEEEIVTGFELFMKRLSGDNDYSGKANNIIVANSQPDITPAHIHTDISNKTIIANLENTSSSNDFSISFKFIPTYTVQTDTLLYNDFFGVYHIGEDLVTVVGSDTITFKGPISTYTCNHVVVSLEAGVFKTYFNGAWTIHVNTVSTALTSSSVTLNPYAGRLWDVRLMNSQFTPDEVRELSEYCVSNFDMEEYPIEDYPNSICAAYMCLWGDTAFNFEEEKYTYFLTQKEKYYELNVFTAGSYPEGRVDEFIDSREDRGGALTEKTDRVFVKNYSFDENPFTRTNSNFWTHENFHTFQLNTDYHPTKWVMESTAEWGSDLAFPGCNNSLLAYYTMHPHLPLWTTQSSPLDSLFYGWEFKGGHQYGAYIFWSYITKNISDDGFIGRLYNSPYVGSEPLYGVKLLLEDEGVDLKEMFGDYVASVTVWDFHNGLNDYYRDSEEGSVRRMTSVFPDAWSIDKKMSLKMDETGTGGVWTSVPERLEPGSWAFNAYEVVTDSIDREYEIKFMGVDTNAIVTKFEVRIVHIHADGSENDYYELEITDDIAFGNDSISMNLLTEPYDSIYLVVATTPEVYSGFDYNYYYNFKISSLSYENVAITEDISLCSGEDYTFPDGTTETNISVNINHISNLISEVSGRDTVVTTNITVNPVSVKTENIEICEGEDYTFPDGTLETDISANIIHESILTSVVSGCDSTVTTNIQVNSVDISVIADGNAITANEANADSYQWFDCDLDLPVEGETNQTFVALETGTYSVVIEDNNCIDTSACNSIIILGIDDTQSIVQSIWPNPTSGKINIEVSENKKGLELFIHDMSGRVLITKEIVPFETSISVELPGASGVYFVQLKSNLKSDTFKIIKK